MKKILYGVMAATMIFATSCENELEVGAAGEESVVSFTISTPDMGSRAYSNGATATVLQYAVYEGETELTDLTKSVVKGNAETINGSKEVQLKLTTGNTYSVIFWAAAPNAPYTVDFANKTMKVNYEGAVSNDENRDAFYAKETFTVTGAQTETITLKRPFAQLNIGTSDYAASTSAGYTPTQSKVVVSNVYGKLNLWDGDVDSSVVASFDFAAIDTTEQFPVSGFKYLAMNYALVSKDKETVDVEFTYTDGSDAKTRKVGSVPVQRNYRTNIYGQLLTSDVAVNVVIEPEYDGANGISTVVFNNEELQAALDAATTGTTTIYLGQNIEGDVVDFQKADRNIVIEGGNNKYNGTIKIHTGSNYNNGTIKIQNVAFETSTASLNFIMPNEVGTGLRYPNNVTVEKCTFTATGAAENTAVGVQAKSCKNLQIIGCTATGMHSLVQAQSCDEDVIVKECTINGKNGVAFKAVKNAVVEGTKINAAAYGIRFDGNIDNYSITAKDINVTAVQPFIIRKMTGANNTITLEGNNTLTASEGGYQVVITKGSDDEAYSMPTGSYTLTGAENFIVYPGDEVATTANEIANAIANGATEIYLTAGNYILPSSAKGKTISFIGSGNAEDIKVAVTKIGTGGENCDYSLDGSTVTFENITITTNSSTYIGYARCNGTYKNCIINGTYTLYGNSVFEECTFNVSGDVYNIWTWGAPEATFTDCTFNCDGKSLLLYGQVNTKLTVNNCTFNDNGSISGKAAIEIGNDYNKSYELIVNNTTVNGFDINPNGFVTGTTLWANKNSMPADKLKVTVDGKDAYTNLVYDVDGLKNMLNSPNATFIELGNDITGDVVITQKDGKKLTVFGNGKKFNGVMTVFGNGNQNGSETLTIKEINFVAKNGADACIVSPDRAVNNMYSYAHNVTVENCTFADTDGTVNCAAIRHEDGGDKNWTVKGCTVLSGMHSILQVNNVEGSLAIEDCKVYSKNGANLNSTTKVAMNECEFDVTGYAVRFGVSSGGNLGTPKNYAISNSTLKSANGDGDAVIIFRASAVDATLTLTNTTLVGNPEISGATSATNIIRN